MGGFVVDIIEILYALIGLMMMLVIGTSLWEVFKVLEDRKFEEHLDPLKSHAVLGVVGSAVACLIIYIFIVGQEGNIFQLYLLVLGYVGGLFIALYEGAKAVQRKAETSPSTPKPKRSQLQIGVPIKEKSVKTASKKMKKSKIDDVLIKLYRLYATNAQGNASTALNRLKSGISALQAQGKSKERAVLELALLAGMEEYEIQYLMKRGKSRHDAFSEFLKGETLTITYGSLETEKTTQEEKRGF